MCAKYSYYINNHYIHFIFYSPFVHNLQEVRIFIVVENISTVTLSIEKCVRSMQQSNEKHDGEYLLCIFTKTVISYFPGWLPGIWTRSITSFHPGPSHQQHQHKDSYNEDTNNKNPHIPNTLSYHKRSMVYQFSFLKKVSSSSTPPSENLMWSGFMYGYP